MSRQAPPNDANLHAMSIRRRELFHLLGAGGLWWSGCAGDDTLPEAGPTGATEPDESNKPWWLRGNFAPVDESEAFDLEVVGTLPPELDGIYVRNGPNPLSGDSGHWFLGDGMVHGVRLEGGKASWYRARFVQTDALGAAEDGAIGPPGLTDHQANTALVHHADKLLCLEEVGLPYRIDTADLSTIGAFDFGGKLAGPMTAHPKIDPVTGELFFFGYELLNSAVHYHRVDARGVLVQSEIIELPAPVMMHDFQITETHVVFMDLPILFDLELAIDGASLPFRWDEQNGARIGVMPRTGSADEIAWFDIDPCFVFHTFNAHHDPEAPGRIHLDAIRYSDMWAAGPDDFSGKGAPWRFTMDLSRGDVSNTQIDDRAIEFPRIDPRLQGRAHRYGYGVLIASDDEGMPNGGSEIVKYDFNDGSAVSHQLDSTLRSDEPSFVPASDDAAEDEGWLMSFVYDRTTDRSRLLVLDASNPKSAPVAEVKLPSRVPHGFHGLRVPSSASG